MLEADLERIVNAEAVTSIFGDWPSFHDAEIRAVRMRLEGNRTPCLEADVHVFDLRDEVDADCAFRRTRETLVTFWFEGVREVDLDGFSFQNVLWDLTIADVTGEQHENIDWEVTFEASVGLAGSFRCGTIAVLRAEPFVAADDVRPSGIQSGSKPGAFDDNVGD